jgi:hypothetical protein
MSSAQSQSASGSSPELPAGKQSHPGVLGAHTFSQRGHTQPVITGCDHACQFQVVVVAVTGHHDWTVLVGHVQYALLPMIMLSVMVPRSMIVFTIAP